MKCIPFYFFRNGRVLELDFMSDPEDILNPVSQELDGECSRPVSEPIPKYRRSLREYLSILYLKPRMKIVLRSKFVMSKYMTKSLCRTEKDLYKPTWMAKASKPIVITFGFNSKPNDDYGVMIYNKNRLIKAFEHLGCQKSSVC